MQADQTLMPFVRKLQALACLDLADRAAVLALPKVRRQVSRGRYITREGAATPSGKILLSGFAFSSKSNSAGARAVLALHMEGDQLDISGCFGSEANCDVQALTSVEYAEVARQSIRALARERPQVGMALWRLTARNAAILGEWLTNVGRRNARGRVSHLMCEIAARQHELGTIGDGDCSMPLTQEQIGDSTGLTAVHVNRVIRSLRHDHLIECDNRRLRIVDWEGLKRAGDFQPEYLQSECVD